MPREPLLPVADSLFQICSAVKTTSQCKHETVDSSTIASRSAHVARFATHEATEWDGNVAAETRRDSWSNSPEIVAYQSGVFQATGVRLDIDENGRHDAPRPEPMCGAVAGASPWCRDCRAGWRAAPPPTQRSIDVRRCYCAVELLRYCVDIPLGAVVSCHVLSRPCTLESGQHMLSNFGRVVDSDRYAAALAVLAKTPVIEPARMHAAMYGLANLIRTGFNHDSAQRCDAGAEPRICIVARRFVAANFLRRVSLGAVARAGGVSPGHLCRVFRRLTGCTLVEYVSTARINYARGLLEDAERPISDIALSCGFGSSTRFYEAFKVATGITPTEYRVRFGSGS